MYENTIIAVITTDYTVQAECLMKRKINAKHAEMIIGKSNESVG
jgi:hypothetical protein